MYRDIMTESRQKAAEARAINPDAPDAANRLKAIVGEMLELHQTMKLVNKHYRKHGTCKGLPGISEADAIRLDAEASYNKSSPGPYVPEFLNLSRARTNTLKLRLSTLQDKQLESGSTAATQ